MIETSHPPFGEPLLQHHIGGVGSLYHIRCKECGDDRHRHNNRIKEFVDDTHTHTHGGDDKRELTDLRHGETTFHGRLQRLSTQEESHTAKQALSDENGEHKDEYRHGILDEDSRIDHHTHRDKEDGAEKIFHRFHQLDNLLCLDGLCQYRTHDKGTEGTAEAHRRGYHRHQTTKCERHDKQCLTINQFSHRPEEKRYDEDTHNEP